jgi:hypothetical protein
MPSILVDLASGIAEPATKTPGSAILIGEVLKPIEERAA